VIARVIQLGFQDTTRIVFYEMLHQYMQLRVTNHDDVIKHRMICFVIANWVIVEDGFGIAIFEVCPALFTYLFNTLSSSEDKWTQLFALIALKQVGFKENEISEMNGKLLEIINRNESHLNGKSIYDILKSADAPTLIGLQLYMTAQSLT